MNKKEAEEITTEMLLTDALLKIKSLEKLLITKGVFSQEEYNTEVDTLVKIMAKTILLKANVIGDLDALVNDAFGDDKKSK